MRANIKDANATIRVLTKIEGFVNMKISLSEGLLLALIGYGFITGFSLPVSIACFAFAPLYAWKLFLDSKKPNDINDDVLKRLAQMEQKVSAIQLGNGLRPVHDQKKY